MTEFDTRGLPAMPDVVAPDGSDVRILVGLPGGGMAHFTLAPGQVSAAVVHRTVEEIWYVVAGRGQMWRWQRGREAVDALRPGVSLTIPLGTRFQFRCMGEEPLQVVAVTMPPWPGEAEAVGVPGPWEPEPGSSDQHG
jgi:mannose-6-phosphate isomerase-like protein (cupin superfamily)